MECTTVRDRLRVPRKGCVFDLGGLYAALEELVDWRKARGKRYPLALVLLLVVLAKLCGQDHPSGIADWAQARVHLLVSALHLRYPRMPCHNTYRRILRNVDVSALQRVLDRFLRTRGAVNRSIVIAMDGKTLRGTVPVGQTQGVHLLAAFAPHERLVLMQVAVDGKENEITAAPELLGCLDLGGKVIVADAMHCQRELSIQIVAAGGHYVWLTKDNQPRTRQAIADLFELPRCVLAHEQATAFPSVTKTDKDHGRLEERTLVASDWLNGYLDWPHLGQVFRIERRFTYLKDGSIHSEVVYGLTDLRPEDASPDQLLSYVRDYWGIENKLHYPRDKTLHEDGTRMTCANQAQAMAAINNLIIALIAHAGWSNLPKARRYYDGNVDVALDLILRIPGPT